MSWKKLATVAMCALMATPAWAGPSLHLANTGLNAGGNWTWELRVNPDDTLFTDHVGDVPDKGLGGSLAVELGLQASLGSILSITSNPSVIPNATTGNAANPVEFLNPGNVIFGWETLTDVDPSAVVNMKPVGIQIGTGGNTNQAFLALGTTFFTAEAGANGYLIATIETTGPESSQAVGINNLITSTLSVTGRYDGAGNVLAAPDAVAGKGALAQSTGATTAVLYDDFKGDATRVVKVGDTNLSGVVDFTDFQTLQANYTPNMTPPVKQWQHGDFNNSGVTDFTDFQSLQANYNGVGGSNTAYSFAAAGAGAGSGAIPEPASIVLAGLAMLAGAFIARRK